MISRVRLSLGQSDVCFPPERGGYSRDETWFDGYGREYGHAVHRGDELWLRIHRLGSFLIRNGAESIVGFPEGDVDLWTFRDGFFHAVLPWILERGQWECLHGSAVLVGSGVVAFCGPSNRGKSTLAQAWCARGAVPYADDTVAFLIRDGAALAARLPQRPRLREPASAHYPAPPREASDGFIDGRLCHDLDSTLRPLRAIYWMEPLAEPDAVPVANLERVAGEEAFSLLLGQARLLSLADPARRRELVENYLCLIRSTPVFRLSIPASMALLPAALDFLERRHLSQNPS